MFYIHHPKCRVPLHIVEDCVFTRLQYLKLLHDDKVDEFDGQFEYLFDDSLYDRVGHFTLRLIASTSHELRHYWLIRERKLLRHRLNNLLPKQIHRLLRKILRHTKTYDHDNSILIRNALMTFSGYFLEPRVFSHIVGEEHKNDCELYSCLINFQSVPDLIKTRKIHLKNGFAIVTCSMWKDVLEALFNSLIQHEYKHSQRSMKEVVELDPRLNSICRKIKRQILQEDHDRGTITTENIDTESRKFPLCMQHFHHILRDRHRLSHYARFYYSLFLKECGMDLENAINYWKEEYSKPHTCTSGCVHDWQTSEKKFVYSIRHLYGLEGGRKHYKAPNCEMIHREIPGPRYEGGCPFKHFESSALADLFGEWPIQIDMKEQLIENSRRQPQVACGLFQKIINKSDTEVVICSPVHYYSNSIKSSNQK